MSVRKELGDAGERLAERYLVSQAFQILDRKWRTRSGEIDLVALDGDMLVFCEVKTRRGEARGAAEEAIDHAKGRRLLALGEQYVIAHPEHAERYWRIDLIAITLDQRGGIERLRHIPSAVESG